MQDQHILFILEVNTVVGSTRKFYTKIKLRFMVLIWHKGWNFFPGIEISWRVAEKETWPLWQERPFVCGYWGSGSWPGSWPIQVNPWCKLYKNIICISFNFSHMFEKFIRKVRPKVSWSHETASIDIFQRIVDQLWEVFKRYGLDGDDIIFIKVFTTLIC